MQFYPCNTDLWERARAAGLNLSEVAETAIATAFVAVERARIRTEIEQELEVYNEFVAEHGSFADMMREREAVRERDEAA